MKGFDYFLKEGDVRKVSIDLELAKALIKDMHERIKETSKKGLSPKTKFENLYDALRDFCDALLAINGFKSYSHQASISFLKKFGFEDSTLNEFDMLRYKRNSSKYYGKPVFENDWLEIKGFYERLKSKINKIIKEEKLE